MISDSTKQFLANYHDASKRLETRRYEQMRFKQDPESDEIHRRLTTESRELITRCILGNDPRSMVFLIRELEIALKVAGRPDMADSLNQITESLALHVLRYGTL